MKKVITVITVCMIACLLVVGLIPTTETVYATGTGQRDFNSNDAITGVPEIEPERVSDGINTYYRVNYLKTAIEFEGVSFNIVANKVTITKEYTIESGTDSVNFITFNEDKISEKDGGYTIDGIKFTATADKKVNFTKEYTVDKDGFVTVNSKKIDAKAVEPNLTVLGKWKWIVNHVNDLNNGNNVVILVEKDMDFTNIINTKPLKATVDKKGQDLGIKFNIIGGTYIDGKVEENATAPVINNYYVTDSDKTKNNAFITKLNGGKVSNLNFTNFNLATTAKSDYVGLVGEMEGGELSKIAVSGTINTPKIAGGLVGKMQDGTISNCDYQGTIKGSVSGGLVGKIIMQETKKAQNINVNNSYVISNKIEANEVAGGIIGSIEFANQVDYQKNVKINVNSVFAKITEFKLNKASKYIDKIDKKEKLNYAPYGVVGKVDDNMDFVEIGSTVQPKLPLNEILKFTNIVTPNTCTNTYNDLEGTPIKDEKFQLLNFPVNIPNECYSDCKTIDLADFNKAINFGNFKEAWVMDTDHLELAYKKTDIGEVTVTINQVKGGINIVEADKNNIVKYTKGNKAIFTINYAKADGIYVNKIIGKKEGNLVTTLFTAATDFSADNKTLFTTGFGTCTGCEFDYFNYQLIIESTEMEKYDEIVFDFTDGSKNAENKYKVNAEVADKNYEGNGGTNLLGDINVYFHDGTPVDGVEQLHGIDNHNGVKLYIPKTDKLNAYILDGVKIKAYNREEYLASGTTGKGYIKENDEIITIGGTKTLCKCYTIKINDLSVKLRNLEHITIQFIFRGNKADVKYKNNGMDLVYKQFINVDYLYQDNGKQVVTSDALIGNMYDVRIALNTAGAGSGYVFNLLNKEGNLTINIAGKAMPVEFEKINGEYTGKIIIKNVTFSEPTEIEINLAKINKVKVSNVSKDLYNAPSIIIGNIPVIKNNAVVGYVDGVKLNFADNMTQGKGSVSTTHKSLITLDNALLTYIDADGQSVKAKDFADYISNTDLLTISDINHSATYTTVDGVETSFKYEDTTNQYSNLTNVTVDGSPNNAVFEGIKKDTLTNILIKDHIIFDYNIKKYDVTIIPYYIYYTGEVGAWVENQFKETNTDKQYKYSIEYGKMFSLDGKYPLELNERYEFVKWTNEVGEEMQIDDIRIKKQETINLVLKPKYSISFTVNNSNMGTIKNGNHSYTNGEEFIFGSEQKGQIIFTIASADKRYKIDKVSLQTQLETLFAQVEGDEYKLNISIDATKLMDTHRTTVEVAKLIVPKFNISVDFIEVNKTLKVNSNTTVSSDITINKVDYNGYKAGKLLLYGTTFDLIVLDKEGYSIKVTKNGTPVKNPETQFFNGERNINGKKYYVYSSKLVADENIVINYKEDAVKTVYTVTTKVQLDGKDVYGIADIIVERLPNADGTENVYISYNAKSDAYTFEFTLDGVVQTAQSITIEKIDKDYDVVLVATKKTHSVELTVPTIEVNKPAKFNVFIDGVGYSIDYANNKLVALDKKSTTGITVNVEGTKVTFSSVPYNTNIYFELAEEGYKVNAWREGAIEDRGINNYNLGGVKEDRSVVATIKKLVVQEVVGGDEIFVTHHMKFDGISTSGNTKFVGINNDKVVLEAIPTKGNVFVKWLKNGVDFADTSTITVANDDSIYEAVFAKREYKINIINPDLATVTGVSKANGGETVTLSLNIKQGYTVDKVIVNGKEQLLGNVKSFTIRDINEDQNVEIVYRKVGQNAEESKVDDVAKKLAIGTLIVLIVAVYVSRKLNKKFGGKIKKNINID